MRRVFVKAVRARVSQESPILAEIRQRRVHEGRSARMTREDKSTEEIRFQQVTAALNMPREQMKEVTVEQLLDHVHNMAAQFAEQQTKFMFATLTRAVEEVGNSVSAAEMGTKEAFLEMNRRMEVEFDPDTLEPKNLVMVLHPSQIDSFKAQAEEWENDPAFRAQMARIRNNQLEAWRARENRRKLVD